MKKLLIFLVVVCASFSINGQNFNIGVSAGLPSGDASDAYTFSAIIDASYLTEVSKEFHVGGAVGFIYSFGDSQDIPLIGSVDIDDAGFLPLAAAGRYTVSEEFVLGADIGYALGVTPSELDGGFYYAPRVQYYFLENLSAVASYRGVSVSGGSFDFLTLGVEFKL